MVAERGTLGPGIPGQQSGPRSPRPPAPATDAGRFRGPSNAAKGNPVHHEIDRSYHRLRCRASSRAPVLVGRAAELAALNVALRLATEADAHGHPDRWRRAGLGKSRLVAEFGAGARAAGARVLTGTCLNIGGEGLPYGPFLEALRELGLELPPAQLRELIGGVAPELVAIAPGYARFLGEDEPGDADDDGPTSPAALAAAAASNVPGTSADQNRLFELSLALMDRLAADRPLVLVLEDLHWSDPASSDLLVFIVRTMRRGRLLLIGTFRTDDLEHGDALLVRLAELTRWPNVTRIELRPLGLDRPARDAHRDPRQDA